MIAKKFKNIFNFKAFEPHPGDDRYSLRERLNKETFIFINYGMNGWEIAKCKVSSDLEILSRASFFYKKGSNADTEALDYLKSIGENLKIALSWGVRPTFSTGKELPVETLSLEKQSFHFNKVLVSAYFQKDEYRRIEKILIDQKHCVVRTQLTAFNIISHMLCSHESNTGNVTHLVIDQGFASIFRVKENIICSIRTINTVNGLETLKEEIKKEDCRIIHHTTANSSEILDSIKKCEELESIEWQAFESELTKNENLEVELITNE